MGELLAAANKAHQEWLESNKIPNNLLTYHAFLAGFAAALDTNSNQEPSTHKQSRIKSEL